MDSDTVGKGDFRSYMRCTQPKHPAFLTLSPTNIKWSTFDGGGVCTGEI